MKRGRVKNFTMSNNETVLSVQQHKDDNNLYFEPMIIVFEFSVTSATQNEYQNVFASALHLMQEWGSDASPTP